MTINQDDTCESAQQRVWIMSQVLLSSVIAIPVTSFPKWHQDLWILHLKCLLPDPPSPKLMTNFRSALALFWPTTTHFYPLFPLPASLLLKPIILTATSYFSKIKSQDYFLA